MKKLVLGLEVKLWLYESLFYGDDIVRDRGFHTPFWKRGEQSNFKSKGGLNLKIFEKGMPSLVRVRVSKHSTVLREYWTIFEGPYAPPTPHKGKVMNIKVFAMT